MLRRMMLAAASGASTDPYWANVVSLLHFDGSNGSTTFADQKGKSWTVTGSAQLTTAVSKFGSASGEIPNTPESRIDCTHADFNFGTGDYTIEIWMRPGATSNRAIFSFGARLVYIAANIFAYFNGSTNLISGGTGVSTANFYHVLLQRASGTTRLAVNGVSIGVSASENGTSINPGTMRIGYYNAGNPAGTYYDDFRCTVGVARYTTFPFTPPSAPFPNS